jgi:hypothetical protein
MPPRTPSKASTAIFVTKEKKPLWFTVQSEKRQKEIEQAVIV